jgi:hypothetical protein
MSRRLAGEVARVRKGRIGFQRDCLCELSVLAKLGIIFRRTIRSK